MITRSTLRHGLGAAMVAMLTFGTVAQVAGQNGNGGKAMEAAELRARAQELYSDLAERERVVQLHLRAARSAGPDDPERVADFRIAGIISAHLRRYEESLRHLEAAADLALDFGNLTEAGDLFILAAVAARKVGNGAKADHFLIHAERLSLSPILTDEECDCLKQRVALHRAALKN